MVLGRTACLVLAMSVAASGALGQSGSSRDGDRFLDIVGLRCPEGKNGIAEITIVHSKENSIELTKLYYANGNVKAVELLGASSKSLWESLFILRKGDVHGTEEQMMFDLISDGGRSIVRAGCDSKGRAYSHVCVILSSNLKVATRSGFRENSLPPFNRTCT